MRCLFLSVLFFCCANFGVVGASVSVDAFCCERMEFVDGAMMYENSSDDLEAERKRKQAEARRRAEEERIACEKAEQARVEQERIVCEKAEQEAKKNQASSLAGSAFQNMGNKEYRGYEELDLQRGHSWSLNGRDLLSKLVQPSYQGNEEGRIVVEIRVDASGNVVLATITKGTTIINETFWDAARSAAKKNKFSSGSGVVIGTITYNYYGLERNLAGSVWTLSGRDLLGRLPQPIYQGNEEGRIVVEICVDAEGNVVFADIAKGTTVSSETLRDAAIAAAKKTKFSPGNGIVVGTITYNFRLN